MREVYKPAMILKKYFPIGSARITLIARMVPALIKVGTVCLGGVAAGFSGKAGSASDEKRVRGFPKDFPSDSEAVARFTASELPESQRILTMYRTYRESGRLNTGIPMPAVVYEGAAIPPVRKFPGEAGSGKKGNSDTGERIGPISRFIRLFGAERCARIVNSLAVSGSGGSEPMASLSVSGSGRISILRIPQVLPDRAVYCPGG